MWGHCVKKQDSEMDRKSSLIEDFEKWCHDQRMAIESIGYSIVQHIIQSKQAPEVVANGKEGVLQFVSNDYNSFAGCPGVSLTLIIDR